MEQFCHNIQKDVIQAIKVPFSEAPQRLKRELAIRLSEKGLISFGKARELSEMTRWAFQNIAGISVFPFQNSSEERVRTESSGRNTI
jgi:predicted HTH domain antitoxin